MHFYADERFYNPLNPVSYEILHVIKNNKSIAQIEVVECIYACNSERLVCNFRKSIGPCYR